MKHLDKTFADVWRDARDWTLGRARSLKDLGNAKVPEALANPVVLVVAAVAAWYVLGVLGSLAAWGGLGLAAYLAFKRYAQKTI